jgi:isoleucyl-tRNA synthetase
MEESIHLRTITPPLTSTQFEQLLEKHGPQAVVAHAKELADFVRAEKHWSVLMPLIEKGNKQLDELKRSIGLGNPLDAEAVIIVPTVQDEVSKLIADYGPEIEDALGVGFHRFEQGQIWDIKINDTRTKYPSCARSWKRRPDVGSDKDFPDLSARDAQVVRTLRK